MTIELSSDEQDLLETLLRDELGRLKGEIYKTETADFKQTLKRREALLVAIIGRLESPSRETGAG